jgi:NitT/TauT family transport system ATP-binding protein
MNAAQPAQAARTTQTAQVVQAPSRPAEPGRNPEAAAGAAVRIEQLALRFPGASAPVLAGLDLTVAAGELVAILGASGVGKSTLLRAVAGLIAPSAGRVAVAATPAADRLPVAMVFQDARLLAWRDAAANVRFGLERLQMPSAQARERVDESLALVGLGDYATRLPRQLSGGQRQRVAIARALAVRPEVLLMDEPFGALDAITREAMQGELTRIRQQTGKTILFVTHDIEEALVLADRVVLLAGQPAGIALERRVALPLDHRREHPELLALAAEFRAVLGTREAA